MATSFSRTVREEFRKYRLGPQVSRGREVFFRGPLSYSWNWKEVRIYSLKSHWRVRLVKELASQAEETVKGQGSEIMHCALLSSKSERGCLARYQTPPEMLQRPSSEMTAC